MEIKRITAPGMCPFHPHLVGHFVQSLSCFPHRRARRKGAALKMWNQETNDPRKGLDESYHLAVALELRWVFKRAVAM